ncbi:probable glutamate receptor [Saccostrea echinata]|uniref:probable glutamate receptor n=1 Tax=Saccostrea echinata TaxID=191078 RepID=UPI002A804C85|nr:probable glutamate receptor [Saccostrea echinata]
MTGNSCLNDSSKEELYSCFRDNYFLESNGIATFNETGNNSVKDGLEFLGKAIEAVKWNHATLLFPDDKAPIAYIIADLLGDLYVQTSHRTIDPTEEFIESLWQHRDPTVHAVVIGNRSFTGAVLEKATAFDRQPENIRRTALYAMSYWIVFSMEEESINIENNTDYCLNVSMDNVLLIQKSGEKRYALLALMWRENNTREFEELNIDWDCFGNIKLDLFPNAKFGFNGRQLLTTAIQYKSYVELAEEDGNLVVAGGVCGDIIRILCNKLNFTYRVIPPEDGQWGILMEDGNWTGMIGMLHRREVDIAMVPLTVQEDRKKVVDFTIPFFYSNFAFMMRMPDPKTVKWRIYLDMFSTPVLYAISTALILSSLLLYAMERFNWNWNGRKPEEKRDLVDIFEYIYGALVLQAGHRLPSSTSGRVFTCIFWVSCVSLTAVYCGSLVASMALARREKIHFQTLDELVAQSEYKWGYIAGTYLDSVLRKSNIGTYQKIYNGAQDFAREDPDVLSISDKVHFRKLTTEKYVFISPVPHLQTVSFSDCRSLLSTERFVEDNSAFGVPEDSPFKEIFSLKLAQLQDSGILGSIHQKYKLQNNCSDVSQLLSQHTIKPDDVQTAFFILIAGILIASAVLCCECALSWCRMTVTSRNNSL